MLSALAAAFVDEVNEKIGAEALLRQIGYAADKIQISGDSVKAFCPIHRDTRFRSLILDAKKRNFKCTIKTCDGHAGGSLVDLYALSRKIASVEAAAELSDVLELGIDPTARSGVAADLMNIAQQAFVAGDHEKACLTARSAIQLQPDSTEPRLLLANIFANSGRAMEACDEYMAVAERQLHAQAYAEADRTLALAAEALPENEDIVFLKIRSAELQGQTDQVIALMEALAALRQKAGREMDNIGLFEKLIELKPPDPHMHLELAALFEKRRELKKASRHWEKAAGLLQDAGRVADAIPLLENVLKIEPQLVKLRAQLVAHLINEGEFESAKEHVFEIVNAQVERADFNTAVQSARRWLDIEPDCIEVHESLARIFQEQDSPREAAEELRRAAELTANAGDTNKALSLLFRVKFLCPDDASVREDLIRRLDAEKQTERAAAEVFDLAEMYFAAGQADAAQKVLKRAEEPDFPVESKLRAAQLLSANGSGGAASELLIAAAKSAEDAGDYGLAVEALDQLDVAAAGKTANQLWRIRLLYRLRPAEAGAKCVELAQHLEGKKKAKALDEVLELACADDDLATGHAVALFEIAERNGKKAAGARLFKLAAPRLRGEDPARAVSLAERAAALAPDDLGIAVELAAIAGDSGEIERALNGFTRLSELQAGQGQLGDALATLDRALELTPEDAALLKRRSELCTQLGDVPGAQEASHRYLHLIRKTLPAEQALAEYERYVEQNPGDPKARGELAEFLIQLGKGEGAREHLRALVDEAESVGDETTLLDVRKRLFELDPTDARLQAELADSYQKAGLTNDALTLFEGATQRLIEADKYDEAAAAAQRALEIKPDSVIVLEQLATAERLRGNRQGFEECAEKLIELGRAAAVVPYFREVVEKAVGDRQFKQAEAPLQRWLAIAPDDPRALELSAEVHRNQRRKQKAQDAFVSAGALYRECGDAESASRCLKAALDLNSESVPARQLLFQVLLDAGKQDEAISEMQQLADQLIEKRSYKEASTLLSRILEYRTKSADVLRRLGSLVYEHEGFAKAVPHFRKLIEVLKESSQTADVVDEYKRILRLEGADITLRIEYADYLGDVEDHAGAKAEMLQIAQAFRDELNDPLRAIHFFVRATGILPGNEDARVFEELGTLHSSIKAHAFAADALRTAARMYEQTKDEEHELSALQKLSQLPVGVFARDLGNLGTLLARLGRREDAAQAYRRAIELCAQASAARPEERLSLAERLFQLEPLNADCALEVITCVQGAARAERAIEIGRRFGKLGKLEEQSRILEHARSFLPHDLQIRREIVDLWRSLGNESRVEEELFALGSAAAHAGDFDTARKVVADLEKLSPKPELSLRVGRLLELCGDNDAAVAAYCVSAEVFCESKRHVESAAALTAALALDGGGISASLVANVVRQAGDLPEVRTAGLNFMDGALLARSRTRALVSAAALLERSSGEESNRILQRIMDRAGATFLVAIAGAHADWLAERKRFPEALGISAYTVMIAPNSPDAWSLEGQLQRKAGNADASAAATRKAAKLYQEAGAITEEEVCYKEILDQFPDDAAVLETMAFFYERERRTPDAVETMRRIAAILEPTDPNKSVSWLEHALELAPSDNGLRSQLAELLLKLEKPEAAVEQLLELAQQASKGGRNAEAVAAYERLLSIDPQNERALTLLLELSFRENDLQRIARYSFILADLKLEAGAGKQACKILSVLVDKDPDNVSALQKLASVSNRAQDEKNYAMAVNALAHKHAKRGEYAEAIPQFEILLERKPEDADVLQMLVDCCAADGRNKKAAEYALRLLEKARKTENAEQVRQAAEAILKFDETNATAHRELATALRRLRQPQEAVAEYMRGAELYQEAHDYENVLVCLRAVTDLESRNTKAWKKYAEASVAIGDQEGAREAYIALVDKCLAAGQIESARSALDTLLNHFPDEPAAHERALSIAREAQEPETAVREVLWLCRHHMALHDFAAAESFVHIGFEAAPTDLELEQMRIDIVRKLARHDEVQVRLRELADRFVAEGNLERAIGTYEELIQIEPRRIELRRDLADVLAKAKKNDRAFEELVSAAMLHLERDEKEEAREVAEKSLRLADDELAARERIAELFLKHSANEFAARQLLACAALAAKSRGEAAKEKQFEFLERASTARPRWPDPLKQLAEAAAAAGNVEKAAMAFGKLEQLLSEENDLMEAIAVLRRHIALLPKDATPRRQLIELYVRTGDRENRAAELQDLAELLVNREDVAEAADVYRQLAMLRPEDTFTLQRYLDLNAQGGNELEVLNDYFRLAEAYAARGQVTEATRTYEKILSIDRRNRDARDRFIAFLLANGQAQKASAELLALAKMQLAAGEAADAARTIARAVEQSPGDVDAYLSLGEARKLCHDTQGAIEALSRALELTEAKSGDSLPILEKLLELDTERLETRLLYEQALATAGRNSDAAANARRIAEIYASRGEIEMAGKAYENATRYEPEDLELLQSLVQEHAYDPNLQYLDLVRLGDKLAETGEIDGALKAYRDARGINDEHVELIEKFIEMLVQIVPEHEVVPDFLALADRCAATGNYARAAEVYGNVLRLDPDNAMARAGEMLVRKRLGKTVGK